jgi:DNA primase
MPFRSFDERRVLTSLVPSSSQREFLERASQKYANDLPEDAIEYLMGPKRGLNEEAIERFRLGVVVDPVPGHEQYTGCLSIPYLSNYGILTIRFRRPSDINKNALSLDELDKVESPKYLTIAGDRPRIYNVAALERGLRSICVAEGEFDAIIAEMCDLPCIALPGAQSWKPLWSRLLEQYEAVFLLQDDDEAGKKLAASMGKQLHNLRPVVMTGGDVTSFYVEHGREALREKVIGK